MFRAAMTLPEGPQRRAAFWRIVQINDALTQHIVTATCSRIGRRATEDDLQVGRMGMFEAVRHWRPEVARLSTYAMWWIRVGLQRSTTHPAGAHVPTDLQALRPMVLECERYLAVQGRPYGVGEIAAYLEVPVQQVQAALSLNSGVRSLDELTPQGTASISDMHDQRHFPPRPPSVGSSHEAGDTVVQPLPMEEILQIHGPRMQAVIQRLSERDRTLLIAFANGESYSEMGKRVGLSRERTRQVLEACIETIKTAQLVVDPEARRRKLLARLEAFESENDDFQREE